MDSMGFRELQYKCEKEHEFTLRLFKGWVIIDGKIEEAAVFKDRPACPFCGSMKIESSTELDAKYMKEHPVEVVIEEKTEPEDKGKKKR